MFSPGIATLHRLVDQLSDHFGRIVTARSHTMHPSFLGLDSTVNPDTASLGLCEFVQSILSVFFCDEICMLFHSCFFACRIGSETLRLAITNPTALNKKVSRLLQLKADILTTSETSATSVIQKEITNDFNSCGYRSFWSPYICGFPLI